MSGTDIEEIIIALFGFIFTQLEFCLCLFAQILCPLFDLMNKILALGLFLGWLIFNNCRYKKLLSSVDLTKDFFYSYTYPIMRSLQNNVLSMGEDGMPYDNIFVWNSYLTHTIRSRCKNTMWTIALVHGHFKQVLAYFPLQFFDNRESSRADAAWFFIR